MVSHPNAVNPFPYAFLNFRSNFQLRKVTLTNETFMEWEGCFDTELTVRCACLCVPQSHSNSNSPQKKPSFTHSGRDCKTHTALSACL